VTISVFLADDHAVVRDGLRALLAAQADMTVVGDASNGRDAVRQVLQLRPAVAIVDIAMPEMNGLEAVRQIRQSCPATRAVILSMHATSEHIYEALQAGALGYVLKESAGTEVVAAVRAAHAGRRFLSPRIADAVVETFLHGGTAGSGAGPLARLSSREREVLQLVAEGKSSAEIAEVLFLSPKTVETYRSRLMQKLGVPNLAGLIRFAVQHGLTPLS
jgi:DNA-binding NarL/FixJ family response regulator